MNNRSGYFVNQPGGFKSFVPNKLPPTNPSIKYDQEMINALSKAERMLGRLDGVTQVLPNPELFVAMYVKKEAVLSSQIEGTQASLTDLFEESEDEGKIKHVSEIVNYINAMNYGIERLNTLPLSLRLIREIHQCLLRDVRGGERNPGEFRRSQNWIGPKGSTLSNAVFVPPAVPDMIQGLNDLESFINEKDEISPLIKIALIHAQFESIHPFLDGNGRMGRLLITFWLYNEQILSKPLLYLSYYFKLFREDYYNSLMNVRLNGDWETWIKFFLKGVSYVSREAIDTAKEILELKEECEKQIGEYSNTYYSNCLNYLFEYPVVSKPQLEDQLKIAAPTVGRIVDKMCSLGILKDITPQKQRYKRYAFDKYLSILNRGTEI